MARKKKSAPIWDNNDAPKEQFVSNASAPAEQKREANGTLRRVAVYGFFSLAALAVLLQIGNIAQQANQKPVLAPVDSISVNSSIGKPSATTTLNQWLSANPAPLPGAQVVSWDGYTSIAKGETDTTTQQSADAAEVHYFTLSSPSGDGPIFYTATVLVSVSDVLGAKVVGTPSILPATPSAREGWSNETWAGYETLAASDSVKDAVIAWADAFTGTPAALRLAVGDQSANRSYIPLSGATVVEATISESAAIKPDDGSKPSTILVRTQLKLNWSEDKEGASPSLATYDLLVIDANTAAPRIVAWGGAGSGPTLTKYENAVAGEVNVPKPSPAPTQTGEPAPETDGND